MVTYDPIGKIFFRRALEVDLAVRPWSARSLEDEPQHDEVMSQVSIGSCGGTGAGQSPCSLTAEENPPPT